MNNLPPQRIARRAGLGSRHARIRSLQALETLTGGRIMLVKSLKGGRGLFHIKVDDLVMVMSGPQVEVWMSAYIAGIKHGAGNLDLITNIKTVAGDIRTEAWDKQLDRPEGFEARADDRHIDATWEPVTSAAAYDVKITGHGKVRQFHTDTNTIRLKKPADGTYTIHIRANPTDPRKAIESPWSEPFVINIVSSVAVAVGDYESFSTEMTNNE